MNLKRKIIVSIIAFLLFGSSATTAVLLTQNSAPKTYNAKFYNESAIVATVETEYDKPVTAPSDPTKEGYEFDGWFEDNHTFNVPFNATKAYNKDVSFYAKWQKEEPEELVR